MIAIIQPLYKPQDYYACICCVRCSKNSITFLIQYVDTQLQPLAIKDIHISCVRCSTIILCTLLKIQRYNDQDRQINSLSQQTSQPSWTCRLLQLELTLLFSNILMGYQPAISLYALFWHNYMYTGIPCLVLLGWLGNVI